MEQLIVFVISNFTLSFFVLGIVFTMIALSIASNLNKSRKIRLAFSYFLFFNIFCSYFVNFIMHVFYGKMAAQFIGWSQSPFQLEVGFASLGFAITGLISVWAPLAFRAASVISVATFLWGAAGGHFYQMITEHNFTPGNAGIIFWTDILIPVFSLILLWLQYKNPVSKQKK